MRTIFLGLLPVLPDYVAADADSTPASFDIRLRGDADAHATFVFDGGQLQIRSSSRPILARRFRRP
jgi:hypothetical protein